MERIREQIIFKFAKPFLPLTCKSNDIIIRNMKRHFLSLLLIAVISISVYANTLKNGFVYDDENTIVKNALIKDMWNLPKLFEADYFAQSGENSYRLIVTFTYFLDYALYGLKPWGFHLTNLLLHAVNGILLYIFLTLLFQPAINIKPSAVKRSLTVQPLLSSILFVTHPIQTEAVNAISYREDLLAFLFYIATLIVYLHMRLSFPKSLPSRILYALSCLFYSLALFSKEMAVTLPLIVFCYEWHYGRNKSLRSAIFGRYNMGYIVITIVYGYIRFYYFKNPIEDIFYTPHTTEKLLTIPLLILSYLKLLLFPVSLSAEYIFFHIRSALSPLFLVPIFVIALSLILVIKAKKINKEITFGTLFIIITLIPVYNIFPIANPLAERYSYLPSVGFVLIMSSLILPIFQALDSKNKFPWLLIPFFILIFLYSFGVVKRNEIWRDDYSLWSDMTKKMPESSRAHFGLGRVYAQEKLFDEAIQQYQIARKLNPADIKASVELVIAHYNLGVINEDNGRLDEAIQQYQLALKLDPSLAEAHYNLWNIYSAKGSKDKAETEFKKVLQLKPDLLHRASELRQGKYAKQPVKK